MKKASLASLLLAGVALTSNAQQMLGISTSNWCGTKNIDLNPGYIADSRTRFQLDLFGLNFGVDNSLGSLDFSKAIQSAGGNAGSVFTLSKSKEFSIQFPVADINLPGLMVSIDDKNSFAITTRVRIDNQFNNFSRELLSSALFPGQVNSDVAITSKNFNWTAHMWSELKLTYAREVYNEGEHYIKAGLSIARLGGIGFLSLKGSNLDGHYYKSQDSLRTTNTDLQFATSLVDNGSELANGVGSIAGQFFGKKGGHGLGADIGAVYEYRPEETNSDDKSSNKYKVRGAIAITDLGAIKYDALEAKVHANGYLKASEVSDAFGNSQSFNNYFTSHGYTLDTGKRSTKVHMPTAMNIAVDYFVASHFYVNATWIKNIANRQNYGNSVYSQLSVTPRWDTRYFCVGLPITYSSLSHSMKAGIGFRLSALYFGSDDLLAFVSSKAYGVNFYMGGSIPIQKKRSKSHKGDSITTSKETTTEKG
ncbi:MAG: flagellar motor protein MotB [Flavipsychrobacter sp.]|nr:flagellar motor protein MotB [Flavipsychrobacter sp.]